MGARALTERWIDGFVRAPMPRRWWTAAGRYGAGVVVLAACYYAAAQLGFTLHFTGPIAGIVWLPVGVGIAGLYIGGLQLWPAILIGDLLADQHVSLPLGVVAAQTAGNVLEIVVGVVLLRRFVARRGNEETLQGVGGTAVALAAAAAVSATIGVAAASAGGVIATGHVLPAWRTWWFADFAGALVLVPPVVAWRGLGPPRWRTREVWEGMLVLATVAGSSVLAWQEAAPLTYVVFPALIWSALRLRLPGASVAAAIASAFAVWGTVHHLGAFGHNSLTRGVLQTQLFITVATFSTLCLAGVTAERRRLAEGLSASRLRLIHAAEAEQRRLAHNLHDGAQQRLAALMVRLSIEAGRLRDDPRHADAILRAAHDELGQVLEELRALAHGGYPPLLVDRGLAAVIAEMADHSPVPIEVEAMPEHRLPATTEASAYYVIAEALANALKHARAGRIRVGVNLVGSSVVVDVSDDGAGGAIEAPDSGLQGLRDRVEAVGGVFEVTSQPGHGTRIAATIPILPPAPVR